jgi:hypothetical protein
MITLKLSIPAQLTLHVPIVPGIMHDAEMYKAVLFKAKIDFLNMAARNITVEARNDGDHMDVAMDSVDRNVPRDRDSGTPEQAPG